MHEESQNWISREMKKVRRIECSINEGAYFIKQGCAIITVKQICHDAASPGLVSYYLLQKQGHNRSKEISSGCMISKNID